MCSLPIIGEALIVNKMLDFYKVSTYRVHQGLSKSVLDLIALPLVFTPE